MPGRLRREIEVGAKASGSEVEVGAKASGSEVRSGEKASGSAAGSDAVNRFDSPSITWTHVE
ncbi:hypothetical protein [Halorubrum sp. Hd13]|uniref:hypothetical protein n=1 Tax=Halorubrum sp. Hd13 TaxID=1480728 RepID=UPI000BD503D6|nr:hypothetical protein [Halorubrum sp. Hd13]OYR47070.1 hypothetical protein DJ81_01615 [Halorubrum sp. Hd13]